MIVLSRFGGTERALRPAELRSLWCGDRCSDGAI